MENFAIAIILYRKLIDNNNFLLKNFQNQNFLWKTLFFFFLLLFLKQQFSIENLSITIFFYWKISKTMILYGKLCDNNNFLWKAYR